MVLAEGLLAFALGAFVPGKPEMLQARPPPDDARSTLPKEDSRAWWPRGQKPCARPPHRPSLPPAPAAAAYRRRARGGFDPEDDLDGRTLHLMGLVAVKTFPWLLRPKQASGSGEFVVLAPGNAPFSGNRSTLAAR